MGRQTYLDKAIQDVQGEIAVLQAALARLLRQKEEQEAKKRPAPPSSKGVTSAPLLPTE